MDTAIVVALLALAGSIIATPLSSYFSKKREIEVEWQRDKLNHYKVLLGALSDLVTDGRDKSDANMRFAIASNTITLVAGQPVITVLMAFHNEIKFTNHAKSVERQEQLLKQLMLEIRRDIGLIKKDDAASFDFHLIGRSQNT